MRLSKAYVLRTSAAGEDVRATAAVRSIAHDRGWGQRTKAAGPARA